MFNPLTPPKKTLQSSILLIFWAMSIFNSIIIRDTSAKPGPRIHTEFTESGGNNLSASRPDTANWKINYDTVFKENGEPVNWYVNNLIQQLVSVNGLGAPVTKEELESLILNLHDQNIYIHQLVKYATPRSRKIQNNAHYSYSERLMNEERLQAGLCFLIEHESILKQVHTEYGVHPKDILGILMWESALGKYTGDYRIFNVFMGQILYLHKAEKLALAELKKAGETPDYQKNSHSKRLARIRKNAVTNLAALLRICKEVDINPLDFYGSWGGAIGFVQFMPASLTYAVDGDGDGIINLYDWPDAIFSVANYLKRSGYSETWRSRKRAIFAYNRLDSYVNGVINYADAVWKRFEDSGGFEKKRKNDEDLTEKQAIIR